MSDIPVEGDEVGSYRVRYQRRPSVDPEIVKLRLYRDDENDLLLVEHEYDSATIVTEFDILNNYTVRAKKGLNLFPDFILKAVVAAGYENIDEPDWR